MKKGKVAVLISGRGSNFEALYRNSCKENSNYEISVVISNKKKAPGLEKARELGIKAVWISQKKYRNRDDFEQVAVDILKECEIDLVCLAGYMRIAGPVLLKEFRNRIMNIHPSLLPSFPGLDAQIQAFDYGVKVSGCTVHFVDQGMDTGPIILQRTVSADNCSDGHELAQRILKLEHEVYSEAVELFFRGALRTEGRHVHILNS